MNKSAKIKKARELMGGRGILTTFIGLSQRLVILQGLQGEEGEWFADTLLRIADIIAQMPKTYGQDGVQDPIVYLHYFRGGVDAWITEKDAGDNLNVAYDGPQIQAFGRQRLFGPGDEGGIGYINIQELLDNAVELDLYFSPCKMSEVQR